MFEERYPMMYGSQYSLSPRIVPVQTISPEVILAKEDPKRTLRLLERMSDDEVSKKALDTAGIINSNYISCMRDVNSENLRNSSGISIDYHKTRSLLFGNSSGFRLDISLK